MDSIDSEPVPSGSASLPPDTYFESDNDGDLAREVDLLAATPTPVARDEAVRDPANDTLFTDKWFELTGEDEAEWRAVAEERAAAAAAAAVAATAAVAPAPAPIARTATPAPLARAGATPAPAARATPAPAARATPGPAGRATPAPAARATPAPVPRFSAAGAPPATLSPAAGVASMPPSERAARDQAIYRAAARRYRSTLPSWAVPLFVVAAVAGLGAWLLATTAAVGVVIAFG